MTIAKRSFVQRFLLTLLARRRGAPTARRAWRHAWRMYGPRGENDTARGARFLARSLWYGTQSQGWYAELDGEPWLRGFVRRYPVLSEKLHRPYSRADLKTQQRFEALAAHYRLSREHGWQTVLSGLLTGSLTLATFRGKSDEDLSITLELPGQFSKEGELVVHLVHQGVRICSAAFALRMQPEGLAIDLGCLQGLPGEEAKETVRLLTKACHGARPKPLVIEALRAIGEATGARDLLAVAHLRHIYRNRRKQRSFAFDYDGFWEEIGGSRLPDGDFRLPLVRTPRPLSEIPSKKRAEATRREALVADVRGQIIMRLTGLGVHT
ncbi:MAG: DUF535 domain-containing protein [Zoogloea sp.]|nr:DUF535 domain-containing protein [Zoogloea sp.]